MSSVFRCSDCGFLAQKRFGICPKCKSLECEEVDKNEMKQTPIGNQTTTTNSGQRSAYNFIKSPTNIKRVSESVSISDLRVLYKTLFVELNQMLSSQGGILESQTILIGAAPGTGKSTLCSQICDSNCLYISTEETIKQVSNRFKRVNSSNDTYIMSSIDENEILTAISETECDLIILDSLNSIANGALSYVKYAQIAQQIINLTKERNKAVIIISQVSKNNNIIGMESISHAVDTVCFMERSSINDNVIFTTQKNRFCEVGKITIFRHEENGLQECGIDISENETVGTTQFIMIAGGKKIPMEIQCLITPAYEGVRPIRRANGVDQNKIYIIEAILRSHWGKFNTSDMDIFLASSNGVFVPNGNDIAIANSILSAFTQQVSKLNGIKDKDSLNGSLNLNGNIVGNPQFRNVDELIKMYSGYDYR